MECTVYIKCYRLKVCHGVFTFRNLIVVGVERNLKSFSKGGVVDIVDGEVEVTILVVEFYLVVLTDFRGRHTRGLKQHGLEFLDLLFQVDGKYIGYHQDSNER